MKTMKQKPHVDEEPEIDSAKKTKHPFWKRAHRDWRVWIAVFIMLVCMGIYVISLDYSLLPHIDEKPLPSGAFPK